MASPPLLCIVGPTASGKSAVAVELALRLGGEVIGADSMQVYRRMDIGTAKPTLEEQKGVPHHLIDVIDPDEEYSADRYREEAARAVAEVHGRGKVPIVAGGTGLYLRALTRGLADTPEGDPGLRKELHREAEIHGPAYLYEKLKTLDPAAAEQIHPHNRVRVVRAIEVALRSGRPLSSHQAAHRFGEAPFEVMMLGIEVERETLYRRIDARVDGMMEAGLLEEVKGLLEAGYTRDLKPMRGVGYKEICAHLLDTLPLDQAVELIKRDSRRYAKRQMTWFRKEPVRWMTKDEMLSGTMMDEMRDFLAAENSY